MCAVLGTRVSCAKKAISTFQAPAGVRDEEFGGLKSENEVLKAPSALEKETGGKARAGRESFEVTTRYWGSGRGPCGRLWSPSELLQRQPGENAVSSENGRLEKL